MGILRRFSEIGLRIAERIDRQSETAAILAESPLRAPEGQAAAAEQLEETARAFAQVARAAPPAIALEDRIERGPPLETPPFGPELVCTVPREAALTTRRDEVEPGVRKAIDLSAVASPRRDVDDLFRDLDGLLAREMAQVDAFLCRPADEIITDLCRRLGHRPGLGVRGMKILPLQGKDGPRCEATGGWAADRPAHSTGPPTTAASDLEECRRRVGASASAPPPGHPPALARNGAPPSTCGEGARNLSVPVVVRLERALLRDADVVGLLVRELGQLGAQLGQVQARDLLVEVLGQGVDPGS